MTGSVLWKDQDFNAMMRKVHASRRYTGGIPWES